eukprot:Seg1381.3 transcript_id=Seg1381.3/GoldUCD/mRNA.D3Y31 product="hypothetical protein" protein_id=Seg1381.3/GoldUCD/D3Y31
MGNMVSRERGSTEKTRMRDQIRELTDAMVTLQHEMANTNARIEERNKQIEKSEREHFEETKKCYDKIASLSNMLDSTFIKLENDLQVYKLKVERTRKMFEEDKSNLFKAVEVQERDSKELRKQIKNLEDLLVSKTNFDTLKTTVGKLKEKLEQERGVVKTTVLKLLKQKTSRWEEEAARLMQNYHDTRSCIMQLISLDLGHEEELVCLKNRISLLEGHSRTVQKPPVDRLPRFSSAKLERMKSVHSDALTLRLMKQQSNIETSVYRFPKLNAMMKKESEDFKTPETKLQNVL